MSRNHFTEDEILQLSENPYTLRVSAKSISFTRKFKLLFWTDYCNGLVPRKILEKYGYDPEMLGIKRIEGLQGSIKKEAIATDGFKYERKSSVSEHPDDFSPEKRIQELEKKVNYLEQQMEFLKKISSTRSTKK